jgi:hypothetical protein
MGDGAASFKEDHEHLEGYLSKKVFAEKVSLSIAPNPKV